MRFSLDARLHVCLGTFLLLCSVTQVSMAEDAFDNASEPSRLNRPLRKESASNSQASGRWVEWRAGAKWEGEYQGGKRHGTWSGAVPNTDDTSFVGPDYAGFENPLTLTVELREGIVDGEVTAIDAQRRPVFAWHLERGVLQGQATWWHTSGQLRRQATYRQGLLDGLVIEWNAQGKLTKQEMHEEGRRRGIYLYWHNPGHKHVEGYSYLPGAVTRHTFDWLNLTWTETLIEEHPREERYGAWTAWHPNGQIKVEGAYEKGQAEGLFTWWHENGQKMAEGEYVAGKRHGEWRWWYASGRKHIEGVYDNGEPSDGWHAWTAEGKPATIDRTKAVLVLDWDEIVPQGRAARRSSPPSRPTLNDAATKTASDPRVKPSGTATTSEAGGASSPEPTTSSPNATRTTPPPTGGSVRSSASARPPRSAISTPKTRQPAAPHLKQTPSKTVNAPPPASSQTPTLLDILAERNANRPQGSVHNRGRMSSRSSSSGTMRR